MVTETIVLPPILPHDLMFYFALRMLHTPVALAFFALILLHLAAALVHGLIRRDGLLQSMTFGARSRAIRRHSNQPRSTDNREADLAKAWGRIPSALVAGAVAITANTLALKAADLDPLATAMAASCG